MTLTSALAIYFIIWWVTLFAVLPFGVRNAHESGQTVEGGNDAGAPVRHGMAWKAGVTTVVATAVFFVVYFVLANDLLSASWVPGLPESL